MSQLLNILELYKLGSKTSGGLKSAKAGIFTPEELQTLQKAFFFFLEERKHWFTSVPQLQSQTTIGFLLMSSL